MRGIILAGGTGSRLFPITLAINKQLIPVYDKPMIYYPLTTLMLAGIREILIITSPDCIPLFKNLLKDGSHLGLKICYATQEKPNGLAEAFLIGRDFISQHPSAMILGDNIFFGHELVKKLSKAVSHAEGATIFTHWVAEPNQYGVIKFNQTNKIEKIIEKPKSAPSNWVVTGLYFFDQKVSKIAENVIPSARGELEIVDILNTYLKEEMLRVEKLGRGYTWLDTGTPDGLLQAAQYVQTIEQRQGLKIACPEEVATRMKFIQINDLKKLARNSLSVPYGKYLQSVADSFTDFYQDNSEIDG